MHDSAPLKTAQQDGVLTVTLNRPESRNAINIELTRALAACLGAFDADAALKVLVVTGTDPAFCAGLDLKAFSAPDSPRAEVSAMVDMWPRLKKPVIAAVNGAVYTGGLEIALGCDFIVASERAIFCDTHARIGALAGGGMNARLPSAVGLRWAKQMSFSGLPVDAQTALRIGLANEVIAHDRLLGHVLDLATTIAKNDLELLMAVKGTMDRGAMATMAEALYLEKDVLNARKARGGIRWESSIASGTGQGHQR